MVVAAMPLSFQYSQLFSTAFHIACFLYSRQGDYVVMEKSESAEGFYNDGLTFVFENASGLQDIRPKHIHFEVMTEGEEDVDFESCDLRLYSVEPVEKKTEEESALRQLDEEEDKKDKKEAEITGAPKGPSNKYQSIEFSDVAFFRLGYFGYQKLNVENMLQKYSKGEPYIIDLWLDWDDQRASIYINNEPIKSAAFFTQRKDKLEHANALSIYGLSPGSKSKFKSITVCDGKCLAQKDKEFETLSGALSGIAISGF